MGVPFKARCQSQFNMRQCELDDGHAQPHKHTEGNTVHQWAQPFEPHPAGVHDGWPPEPVHDDARAAMKSGKLMLELIDLEFVADMARQLQAGLVGERVPDGWRKLDPELWVRKYRGALLRHLVATERGPGAIDERTGATHWAGVAVNAMICGVLERIALTATPADPDCGCPPGACVCYTRS